MLPSAQVFSTVKTERVGSLGSDETTLLSITIPPGVLKNIGDCLRVTAIVSNAANANVKTAKLYVGANTFAARGGAADNGASYYMQCIVTRLASDDCQGTGFLVTTLGNINVVNRDSVANNWDTPIEIRVTGQGTSNDDLVSRLLKVEYLPAGSNYTF
jgi:hypothetical protein